MKLRFLNAACLFVLISVFACSHRPDTSLMKEGDILFQNNRLKNSDFTVFISGAEYNNPGVLFLIDKKLYVLEAVQPVQLTPVASWINGGEDKKYVIKRLKEDNVVNKESLKRMQELRKEFLGKPLDSQYEWSDKAFYPAELVWKVYKKAFDIELCAPQTLADFDLSDENIKQKVKDLYGSKVPLYDEIVTPKAIFESSALFTVYEN